MTTREDPVTIREDPAITREDPVTTREDPVTIREDPVTTREDPATINQRDSAGQYTPPYGQGDSFDHTSEFDPNDIKEHKVYCMLIYLMGTVGIIIALLGGADSEYTKFHVREGLKIAVANMLAALATIFLFWTLIIPLITSIFMTILMVVKVICFVRICKGKAIETPIIRGFKFLN